MKERGRFLPLIVSVIMSLAHAFVVVGGLGFKAAYADGNSLATEPRYQRPTTRQYNDRLPPVMPGEEIVTETGQKIKTWSSSGPVPVNRRAPPQAVGNGAGLGGVIVDTREHYGQPAMGGAVGVQPLAPRGR